MLPQAHLLGISVVDICGVAWNGRSVGEDEGGKVSGVETVIVESSGNPFRFVSVDSLMEGTCSCTDWRVSKPPRLKPRVVPVWRCLWIRSGRRYEISDGGV